jgi:hypothetical protein
MSHLTVSQLEHEYERLSQLRDYYQRSVDGLTRSLQEVAAELAREQGKLTHPNPEAGSAKIPVPVLTAPDTESINPNPSSP